MFKRALPRTALPGKAPSSRTLLLAFAAVLIAAVAVVVPAPEVQAARSMRVDTIAVAGQAQSGTADQARAAAVGAAVAGQRPFRMIGLSWPRGTTAPERFRVHTTEGWQPWVDIDAEEEEGPDAGSSEASPRTSAGPFWADRADGFQVSGTAAGLRVHLVREGSDLLVRSRRGPTAAANVAMPPIRGREEWLARSPVDEPSRGEVRVAFVHHTVSANDYAADDVPALLRGMQAFHMDVNGWDDLGYNFLVDRFGRIWEGRGGGATEAVVGAQTEGFNAVSTGVAIIGTFTGAPPAQVALDSVVSLLAWKLPHHGVDPAGRSTVPSRGNDRYAAGTAATLDNISGHRDGKSTACPGQAFYDRLPWLRREADASAAAVVAYGTQWRGGVFVASAELDMDATPEIVTGADAGGTPTVRTFDADGSLRTSTVVFPEGFRGGVRVAAGNLDAAPGDELVVAAGGGGGPHVRVMREGNVGVRSFFAYPETFTGGVFVATGNVDGLPGDEIVTGPGPGGAPQVRVFRFDGSPIAQFPAFTEAFRGGVRVGTADVDGDGVDEIVAGAGPGGGPQVRIFRLGGTAVGQFFAYGEAFRGGVWVTGVASPDGASPDLVVTGAGDGGGPQVRLFDGAGTVRGQFFSGRPTATSGVRVAAGGFTGSKPTELLLAPGRGVPGLVKISRPDGSLVFPAA